MHLPISTDTDTHMTFWEKEKRPDFVKALTSDNLQKAGN